MKFLIVPGEIKRRRLMMAVQACMDNATPALDTNGVKRAIAQRGSGCPPYRINELLRDHNYEGRGRTQNGEPVNELKMPYDDFLEVISACKPEGRQYGPRDSRFYPEIPKPHLKYLLGLHKLVQDLKQKGRTSSRRPDILLASDALAEWAKAIREKTGLGERDFAHKYFHTRGPQGGIHNVKEREAGRKGLTQGELDIFMTLTEPDNWPPGYTPPKPAEVKVPEEKKPSAPEQSAILDPTISEMFTQQRKETQDGFEQVFVEIGAVRKELAEALVQISADIKNMMNAILDIGRKAPDRGAFTRVLSELEESLNRDNGGNGKRSAQAMERATECLTALLKNGKVQESTIESMAKVINVSMKMMRKAAASLAVKRFTDAGVAYWINHTDFLFMDSTLPSGESHDFLDTMMQIMKV